MTGDVLTLEGDPQPDEPLIRAVMKNGRRLSAPATLEEIRRQAAGELRRLPSPLRDLRDSPPYPVTVAPALHELAMAVDREVIQN